MSLLQILLNAKGLVSKGSSSILKSRNVRGKITSIMSDLIEANEQIDAERNATKIKHEAEVAALNAQIEALKSKQTLLDNKIFDKSSIVSDASFELSVEEKANNSLLEGLKNLMGA